MLPSCRQVCSRLTRELCRRSSTALMEVSKGLAQLANIVYQCSTACNGSNGATELSVSLSLSLSQLLGGPSIISTDASQCTAKTWVNQVISPDVTRGAIFDPKMSNSHSERLEAIKAKCAIGPEKSSATRFERVEEVAHRCFLRVCDSTAGGCRGRLPNCCGELCEIDLAVPPTAIELCSRSSIALDKVSARRVHLPVPSATSENHKKCFSVCRTVW